MSFRRAWPDKRTLPQILHRIRDTQKWSQARLAREIGCSVSTVERWELADFRPSIRYRVRLFKLWRSLFKRRRKTVAIKKRRGPGRPPGSKNKAVKASGKKAKRRDDAEEETDDDESDDSDWDEDDDKEEAEDDSEKADDDEDDDAEESDDDDDAEESDDDDEDDDEEESDDDDDEEEEKPAKKKDKTPSRKPIERDVAKNVLAGARTSKWDLFVAVCCDLALFEQAKHDKDEKAMKRYRADAKINLERLHGAAFK